MSVTSKLAFSRSTSGQSSTNLYGAIAAPAVNAWSGGGGGNGGGAAAAPSSLSQATGNVQTGEIPATFMQICLGVAVTIGAWWAITWILEKLLPHHDTPHFLEDFLHGLRVALIVGVWFIIFKMTTGVQPFVNLPAYRDVVRAF
jgi:hypothetical protein